MQLYVINLHYTSLSTATEVGSKQVFCLKHSKILHHKYDYVATITTNKIRTCTLLSGYIQPNTWYPVSAAWRRKTQNDIVFIIHVTWYLSISSEMHTQDTNVTVKIYLIWYTRDLWKLVRSCEICVYYDRQALPYSLDFKAPRKFWNPLSKTVTVLVWELLNQFPPFR